MEMRDGMEDVERGVVDGVEKFEKDVWGIEGHD